MAGFLSMSDEDFEKQVPPEASVTEEPSNVPNQETEEVVEAPAPAAEDLVESEETAEPVAETPEVESLEEQEKEAPEADPSLAQEETPESDPAKEVAEEAEPVDYKALYEAVMAPFQANKKTIELRSPEEAIKLMQMGANYTRNMQQLAPHRKTMLMLEKAGLLDEGRISYLIDLHQKKPEAIAKLVKDAGIDPLEIDTSKEPQYQEGANLVSDSEVQFRAALDEARATPEGQQTLVEIDQHWDAESKHILSQNPEVLQTIQQQRSSGIYDRISSEIERQRILGNISAATPFISAYKLVGDMLQAQNGFADLVQAPVQQQPVRQPVATRVAKPAAVVNEQVKAAAPNRTVPQARKPVVNYLAMSDEDFEKLDGFTGRL